MSQKPSDTQLPKTGQHVLTRYSSAHRLRATYLKRGPLWMPIGGRDSALIDKYDPASLSRRAEFDPRALDESFESFAISHQGGFAV
jgi:hypothetical protein